MPNRVFSFHLPIKDLKTKDVRIKFYEKKVKQSMNEKHLFELINNNSENEIIEYKTNFYAEIHYNEIGEYISALSNSAAYYKQKYAYMIFGIDDCHNIVGTEFKYDVEINGGEVFKHYLARKLTPSITFNFEESFLESLQLALHCNNFLLK